MFILGLSGIVTGALVILFVFVCVLLILTVLIQRPSGGGLSGAFGSGAGSGQTAFGAKTGDALTIATIIMFVLFLVFAVVLNYAARPSAPDAPAVVPVGGTTPAESTPVAPEGSTTTAPPIVPPATPEQPPSTPPAGEQPANPPANPPAGEPTTPPLR